MTDAGDPRTQDRGYYGAGWQQPAPGPSVGPASVPPVPPQRPRGAQDPRRAFAPGASVANTTGALIAVVSVVLVEFASGLVGLLGTALVVSPFATYGAGDSLIGGFVHGVFLAPLPFHVGAFLALAFLLPVARRSPLPVILLRAVLAGVAGTIALALVGVVTGAFAAVHGAGGARLVTSIVTVPLQAGLPLTLMLVATTTAAWLWLGRPRGGARRSLGAPGTFRQPDAVPSATVQGPTPDAQQQPYAPQQPYAQHPPQQQPQPYAQQPQHAPSGQHTQGQPPYPQQGAPYGPPAGQQPPANPWAPPQR
ncbi:hypothetical protein JOE58_000206 [Curtobacterium luteum]|uniref:Uncharacterized protein n=1 Tax=Curtobacterium luteum TaxID=33881 RepID=A0A8H9KZA9_9MICO|nr:hypothetical protein [Curtobacterium luteum]MBM7800955.1 hypothetical protein [Curtobacterium luteum]NUU50073.1 hypothetical protein [Curtobacterium luteum]GGL10010.1 hypothetical protein GCM10009769_30170 [Curtobacterium luteum]